MVYSQNRLNEMVKKLKTREYRLTPQRLAILRILAESKGHPTVEKIHQQVRITFPTTSLATVYKTVTLLKELGEVLELGFAGESSRYDGNKPYPHPHVVCMKCHTIIDPELDSFKHLTREITKETGYDILNHRLDFFGICPECRRHP